MRAFRGTEPVKCGDETLTLAIDLEIIDAIEDDLDVGFDQVLEISVGKGRIGKTTRLLRGLLVRHHPDITLDEVGALLVDYNDELGQALNRLMEKASPDDEEEEKGENPPNAHRGTGVNSSSRGARQTSLRTSSGSKRPALSS